MNTARRPGASRNKTAEHTFDDREVCWCPALRRDGGEECIIARGTRSRARPKTCAWAAREHLLAKFHSRTPWLEISGQLLYMIPTLYRCMSFERQVLFVLCSALQTRELARRGIDFVRERWKHNNRLVKHNAPQPMQVRRWSDIV